MNKYEAHGFIAGFLAGYGHSNPPNARERREYCYSLTDEEYSLMMSRGYGAGRELGAEMAEWEGLGCPRESGEAIR